MDLAGVDPEAYSPCSAESEGEDKDRSYDDPSAAAMTGVDTLGRVEGADDKHASG